MTTDDPKSLVLVLGAGASKEAGLPLGSELKSAIASALDIRFKNSSYPEQGNAKIAEAFRLIARSPLGWEGDINPLLHLAWHIRDAMPLSISIDNFIDAHRGEENITVIGKLAIARCILEAESNSLLQVDRSNIKSTINFAGLESTWYNHFFKIFTENCQKGDIKARFEKIAIIVFNYDRCVEHYLHSALQTYYRESVDWASEVMQTLEILHPYGVVGELPWKGGPNTIAFGGEPSPNQLIELSRELLTFAEGTDSRRSHIDRIRGVLTDAQRVAFLGFAFHPINLDLLFQGTAIDPVRTKRSVYATAYGISKSDATAIAHEIKVKSKRRSDHVDVRTDLDCAQLLHEFRRALSLL